jgi:hypothetical protein
VGQIDGGDALKKLNNFSMINWRQLRFSSAAFFLSRSQMATNIPYTKGELIWIAASSPSINDLSIDFNADKQTEDSLSVFFTLKLHKKHGTMGLKAIKKGVKATLDSWGGRGEAF